MVGVVLVVVVGCRGGLGVVGVYYSVIRDFGLTEKKTGDEEFHNSTANCLLSVVRFA